MNEWLRMVPWSSFLFFSFFSISCSQCSRNSQITSKVLEIIESLSWMEEVKKTQLTHAMWRTENQVKENKMS